MRLLLDTPIAIWLMRDAAELGRASRRVIDSAEAVYISSASLWEVTIKAMLGKLPLDPPRFEAQLSAAGIEQLPVTWAHALRLGDLPPHHQDPFDRMLIAQAICEPMRLLTHDAMLARYSELVTVV